MRERSELQVWMLHHDIGDLLRRYAVGTMIGQEDYTAFKELMTHGQCTIKIKLGKHASVGFITVEAAETAAPTQTFHVETETLVKTEEPTLIEPETSTSVEEETPTPETLPSEEKLIKTRKRMVRQ